MRKITLFIVLLTLSGFFLHASLIDGYKKGTIYLIPSNDFGIGQDWDSLFYDLYKQMVIAPDGSIFVSNSRQHNIFKFDKDGRKILQFSQRGRGPGDTDGPCRMSILDGKYLTIEENALNNKITIFDFQGKCIKVLKTEHSVYDHCALANNKVAYVTRKSTKSPDQVERKVIIKDVKTGVEKTILSSEMLDVNYVRVNGGKDVQYMMQFPTNMGNIILETDKNGNIVVGVSTTPDIKIFSPDGKLLRSFPLSIAHLKVTDEFIRKYKEQVLKRMENGDEKTGSKPYNKVFVNAVKKTSFDRLFDKYFPYYKYLQVDEEGNILVFKNFECIDNCPVVFQVYSPEGKYIYETIIDQGNYSFDIDNRFRNFQFTSHAVYGLFQLKDSDDISIRLMKMKID